MSGAVLGSGVVEMFMGCMKQDEGGEEGEDEEEEKEKEQGDESRSVVNT